MTYHWHLESTEAVQSTKHQEQIRMEENICNTIKNPPLCLTAPLKDRTV